VDEAKTDSGLVVPGQVIRRTPMWHCPFCDTSYFKGQDKAIAKHADRHDDEIGALLEKRESEPLNQHDEEAYRFWRKRAQERRETHIKGVS
jgi:hypothetical protein